MKKTYKSNFTFLVKVFGLLLFPSLLMMSSCGSNGSKTEENEAKVDDEAFYATQPVHSGLYDADYFDITGSNPRKGHFDGRIYFSLSPEMSAAYVFENGNRTKINQLVILEKPFEKGDSGIYQSVNKKNLPVIIDTDSTSYVLSFQTTHDQYKIYFNPKARHEGSAVEILEKINSQKNKK